jgi:YVTN family beta-propeller protein
VEPPPTPANFHAVFGISTNTPNYPGWATQIDVSGDTLLAETPVNGPDAPNGGLTPTHAALIPNNSKLFVANAGSVQGGLDAVASFSTAVQSTVSSGFGPVSAVSLPTPTSNITAISESGNLVTATLSAPLNNAPVGYTIVISNVVIPGCAAPCNQNGYNGAFTLLSNNGTTITYSDANTGLAAASGGAATFPPQPVFLNSTQNSAMYVANYNANSVSAINTVLNVVSNSAPVGVHPVSLAATPNGLKLYVVNQGSNSVSTLNTTNLSPNTVSGLVAGFTGITPVWAVARSDSQKVYVLTQGDGQLVTIDTATDTVTGSLSVGAGANFIFFDPYLNRLYVTNPATSMVYVFSDTGGANDTPIQLGVISFGAGSIPCPAGCLPTSVTALPDGSRFYVASYQITSSASPCPDPTVNVSPCMIPGLTVFTASSLAVQYPSAPTLTLLTWAPSCTGTTCPPGPFATNQYALPPVAACASPVPPALYAPGATRFRVFTTAAADSSHVYVSLCDGGAIADISTSESNDTTGGGGVPADTLVTDLPAPYAGPTQAVGSPLQSPIFMLTGQ